MQGLEYIGEQYKTYEVIRGKGWMLAKRWLLAFSFCFHSVWVTNSENQTMGPLSVHHILCLN